MTSTNVNFSQLRWVNWLKLGVFDHNPSLNQHLLGSDGFSGTSSFTTAVFCSAGFVFHRLLTWCLTGPTRLTLRINSNPSTARHPMFPFPPQPSSSPEPSSSSLLPCGSCSWVTGGGGSGSSSPSATMMSSPITWPSCSWPKRQAWSSFCWDILFEASQ